jgi:CheY-like chemotaxis protein
VRIAEKPIRFIVDVDPRVPVKCSGDIVRLRQILINLLSNAVKYTREGSIRFSAGYEVTDISARKILLKFAVEDTGLGIKTENLAELFGEFNQFDKNKNRGIEGTGLGLAISRNLCRLMGGDITVESVYGKGSTFRAEIPQTALTDTPLALVKNAENITVLVYDQRKASAESIKRALDKLGVQSVFAETKEAYLALLKTGTYKHTLFPVPVIDETLAVINSQQNPVIPIAMTDMNEAIASKNVASVMQPVYSAPLADAINGFRKTSLDLKTTASFTCPRAKILAVDDVVTNLKVIKGLLLPFQCETDLCTSGKDALKRIEEEKYDLVFMDQMMPEMDGLETLKALRLLPVAHAKETPVIALSANAVYGVREMFIQEGFTDYISKPIELARLSEIMDKWIPEGLKVFGDAEKRVML